jgi:tetratricopeptide (TPR) repeat protein
LILSHRLRLAQAEIEADRNRWFEVSNLCRQAAAAASDTEPESAQEAELVSDIELAAVIMGTRAFLARNRDAEALQLAQQGLEMARKSYLHAGEEEKRWQGLVMSNSVAALAQHATGEFESASESFDGVMSLIDHVDLRSGPLKYRDDLVATALKQSAVFRLAERRLDEARQLSSRALKGSQKRAETLNEAGGLGGSPVLAQEQIVDALLQQAQVCLDLEEWEGAEQTLSDALSITESLNSQGSVMQPYRGHVRVGFILLSLAWMYSRTGRITLAEGLYRETLKIFNLNINEGMGGDSLLGLELPFHPSVGALAAWRYAQLLTALPGRGTEASAWQSLASDLYDDAPIRRVVDPVRVFGSLELLTGKGSPGCGVVLDLMCRRALPRLPGVMETEAK